MTRHIAVFGALGVAHAYIVNEAIAPFDDWQVDLWECNDNLTARDEIIAHCEIAVISPDFILTQGNFGALMTGKNLKMMIQPWVGIDWIDPSFLPEGLLVCNAGGHAAPMAEHVMGAILEHALSLRLQHNNMHKGDWTYAGRNSDFSSRHSDLAGKTLGLVGFGEISRAIVTRARAFDMRMIAVARTKRNTTPAELDWIGVQADLHRLLSEADFVVLTCDLNDETRDMIDTAAFNAMKPSAYLVNVARGEIVEEDALYKALKTQRIAGAALDTWYRYPTNIIAPEPDPDRGGPFQGSRHDFLALDNVLLTPHSAAHSIGADIGRYESIAQSIVQYAKDEPIARHVITGTGGNPEGFKIP